MPPRRRRYHHLLETDGKDKRTVTLAPFDRASNAVFSDMTQSDSSTTYHMQTGSVTFVATDTDKKIKQDEGAKLNIGNLPPTGLYVFILLFDDDPHEGTSFLRKARYGV